MKYLAKLSSVAFVLVCLAAVAFAQQTETRDVQNFSQVRLKGSYDVILRKGSSPSVELTGNAEALERIEVSVSGSTLIIERERGNGWGRNNWNDGPRVKVVVTYTELSGIDLEGSGDITAENVIKAGDFEIELSGSGDVQLELEAGNLEVDIAGSGDVGLSGTAQDVEIDIAGSGNADLGNVVAQNVDIDIAGSGDAVVNCNGNLSVGIAGSGDVRYKGNPTGFDFSTAGSGSVKSMN